MNESEKHKVLMHNRSAVAISVNSPESNGLKFPDTHLEDVKVNSAKTVLSSLYQYIPGVMNPHAKSVQICTKLFAVLYLVVFLSQTLSIFLMQPKQDNNCIDPGTDSGAVWFYVVDWASISFCLHIIFKFRLAYVDPESRVLVFNPKKVARNYLFGYFVIDLLFASLFLPVNSIYSSFWLPLLLSLLQYLGVLCRLLFMFADLTTSSFVYESWFSKFVINFLAFFLFSHVVGSFWYFFAIVRMRKCLVHVCGEPWCFNYLFCHVTTYHPILRQKWKNNTNATACFSHYDYGIYVKAVSLSKESSLPMRYIYSLFWGFQQISTMAGNQDPSFFVEEVLFTMFVSAAGLLLFSLLIGNIQNFLQALGRRKLEMSVRGLDVEQWMTHRRFPEELKRHIRESERYNWLVTRGVDELMLLENLPEDLQRDIRRHLIKFDKKFPTIALMDESILDSIRERMQIKTYIKGSKILVRGGLNDKMVFIVQGNLESIGEDENVVPLCEEDVCGEELVTLCLEHYVLNRNGEKFRIPAQKLLSKRTVRCLTNVEAFTLRAADLEEVFSFYSGLLINNPLLQGAIMKESVYPKSLLRSKSF